jgi:hypothetical protein
MPTLVYRIIEVLSELVSGLPIGTNLGMFQLLWTLLSGRLLVSRGALIPALAASGLQPAAVRRAWAALAYGAWDVSQLLARFQALVQHEGRWQRHRVGGLRPVAVDQVGFFRPRLQACATKHYLSQAGKELPAIPFGVLTAVGSVGTQTVPVLRDLVRAPDNRTVLTTAQAHLATDEYLVADRGFFLAELQAAGVERFVLRVARNFTARRARLPTYRGRGRPPTRGTIVRPCVRTYRGHTQPATPPDRTETWYEAGRLVQAQVWVDLVASTARPGAPTFTGYLITDPAYHHPLLLVSSLALTPAQANAAFRERWPVEQLPQTAKQLLGAHRQFVFGQNSRQRLPELALVCSSLLMYLAATQPAQPTGFWDRAPQPTAGRLRRRLARLQYSDDWPLLADIRKKNAVTEHLPKGITGHRRTPAHPPPAHSPVAAAARPRLSGN